MPTPPPAEIHVPLAIEPDRIAAAVATLREPAILESGPGFGPAGRWSLYAAEPRFGLEADHRNWWWTGILHEEPEIDEDLEIDLSLHALRRRHRRGGGDPLDQLRRIAAHYGLAHPSDAPEPDAPPFQGGLIGYLGYDLAPRLERLPRRAAPDSRFPVLRFGLYDTLVTHDHATGATTLSAYALHGEDSDALGRRLDRWRAALERAESLPRPAPGLAELRSNFTRPAYLGAVRRALGYIRAGDIFQVNISQRYEARGAFDAFDLYRRLRNVSPAPYAAHLAWDDLAIISASPESFYRTRGDRIVTRPIKGTRPRGRTPDDDEAMRRDLQASPKDRAELTMIIDLLRNDLGRVCDYGSVRVAEPYGLESYAQVHHLVATIEGRLRPDCGPIDIIRAVFPGGSITGAPKIRAMEIIDELEPARRGTYTGAIGYWSRGGTSEFNIAIRTMLVEPDRVRYQVGGGIVADSDPDQEYEETLDKARGLRAVLSGAGA